MPLVINVYNKQCSAMGDVGWVTFVIIEDNCSTVTCQNIDQIQI